MRSKTNGDTLWAGELEPLGRPDYSPDDLPAKMAAMSRDGYVVLESIVPPAACDRLRSFIDATEWPPSDNPALAALIQKMKIYSKLVGPDWQNKPDLLEFIDLPHVIDVVESMHGADCRLIGGSLWVTGPGRKQPIHLDYQPIRLPDDLASDPRIIVPVFISTAHIYLDDLIAEPELGPTLVVPGSHRAGVTTDKSPPPPFQGVLCHNNGIAGVPRCRRQRRRSSTANNLSG